MRKKLTDVLVVSATQAAELRERLKEYEEGKMTTAIISGNLSNMLKELQRGNITVKSLVGMPINDRDGKRVGTITEVYEEEGLWYGEISFDSLEKLGELWSKGFSIETIGRSDWKVS